MWVCKTSGKSSLRNADWRNDADTCWLICLFSYFGRLADFGRIIADYSEKDEIIVNKMVSGKQRANSRMQSIECFRLFFSIIVIIAHCISTDGFGILMNGFGYVTVPFFFVVSGYFSYNASERSMRKRFWSVAKLTVAANLLYILWGVYIEGVRDVWHLQEWIRVRCSIHALMKTFLISGSEIKSHLWYLNAIVFCYAAMWMYVCWAENATCDYKPLYITSVCLYALNVVLSSLATASEFDMPTDMYRNALLYGLPMFSLGIFLREYYDKIIRTYCLTKIKLIGIFAVGFFLSVLQIKGTGKVEMPAGALLEVIALILLLTMVPVISKNSGAVSRVISTFGALSTYVYVAHMIYLDAYHVYIKKYFSHLGYSREIPIRCVIVIAITLITGYLYLGIKAALKKLPGRRKTAKC